MQHKVLQYYWSLPSSELERVLQTSALGLTTSAAQARLAEYGANELSAQRPLSRVRALTDQLRSPLLLLLFFAAGASALTGSWVDALIVFSILFASVGISYSREYHAQAAAAVLSARVHVRALVLRTGQLVSIPAREVVPGDVVQLSAGSLVPADAVILEASDCDEALWHAAEETELFVEVDPNQKERIILSLKKMRHVVGFLGDGINDAPAMHAADTSLSVDQAVDVAKEAADFVLMEKDLHVIRRGVEEGRKTFANTLKYVLTTTSANLGNMVSMAAASLFLPFLPLLAGQILLNNFLSDIPAVGIADDSVDAELVDRPRRWDMRFIARFMLVFGSLSSLFDFLTFALLLGLFAGTPAMFRTGWFVESLLTELVVALVVRTRRPFFSSRPGRTLLLSTLLLIPLTLSIPYLPYSNLLGFTPMPWTLLATLVAITLGYMLATELVKVRFYRRKPRLEGLA